MYKMMNESTVVCGGPVMCQSWTRGEKRNKRKTLFPGVCGVIPRSGIWNLTRGSLSYLARWSHTKQTPPLPSEQHTLLTPSVSSLNLGVTLYFPLSTPIFNPSARPVDSTSEMSQVPPIVPSMAITLASASLAAGSQDTPFTPFSMEVYEMVTLTHKIGSPLCQETRVQAVGTEGQV